MHILEKDGVRLVINASGQISEFSLNSVPNIISRPVGLFRAVIHAGDNWELVAFSDDQHLDIDVQDDRITLRCSELQTREGLVSISLELVIHIESGRIHFDSTIINNSDATLNEWFYPCIGTIERLDEGIMNLLYPRHLGERIIGINAYLMSLTGREALHEITATYPGPLSMQWMTLEGNDTCLYLTGRDSQFYASALRAVGSPEGGVTLEMNKMSFVKPGETWQCPPYMAWLYTGNWMQGSQEYASWASSWRKPVVPKDWVQAMNGYFLVINKQQYGDELWSYDTLPQLYEYAQAHGFDVLGLFGWYHSGHDNHYPDLEVSPTMGGVDSLRKNIRKVQNMGGHVTLYFQGHLMDISTKYYKETGHKLEGKTRWGTPYYEYYDKFCYSDYLHFFSKNPFATICPSCSDWHELMAQNADWIHSFGADGILYDQIGGMPPYPCFDSTHEHLQDRPSLSHAPGRIKLHKRIRKQVDQYPDYAYMSEHVTDVHSQFLDCIHGIGSYPGGKGHGYMEKSIGTHDIIVGSAETGPSAMPELFRHTFPETYVTIRNSNPYVSRRFANYAFLYGFKLEMELRYLKDKEFIKEQRQPEDLDYVKKISDLRKTYRKYLLEGQFLAQLDLVDIGPGLKRALYQAKDGTFALAIWNDTSKELPISSIVEGAQWNRWATPETDGQGNPDTIEQDQVMLLFND